MTTEKSERMRPVYVLLFSLIGGGDADSPFASGLGDCAMKSSGVRVIIGPPAAERSSSHSFGGGSLCKKLVISKALKRRGAQLSA
jgi:hypothetical protein